MNQIINTKDFLILILLLPLVFIVALKLRNKWYPPQHAWRPYFIPALTIKIFGALAISFIYVYYYDGGDTVNYFNDAKIINSAISDSFTKWINLVLRIPNEYTPGYYQYIAQLNWYLSDPSTYTVSAITALISSITLSTFLPTAVLFAIVSFTGIWALFRTFATMYPGLVKHIATATLFIPSVALWGSGIFKDTVCLFALGWLTYAVFQMLIKRNFTLSNILLAVFAFVLTYKIKLYILLAFIPALCIWIFFLYIRQVKALGIKIILSITVLGVVSLLSFFILDYLGDAVLGKYSLNKITATSAITRQWIIDAAGEEGSAYDLGEANTLPAMLAKFPLAVNVTFFRPYLWEAKKLIVLLNGLEAFLFFILTLKILLRVGIKKIWGTLITDPNIQFCLIFSFIFAFAVGISSYNFGTLSRYKIPCLPFYALAMLLIYYKNEKRPLSRLLKI